MFALIGNGEDLGWIALKALLLYITAIAGFRLSERRTLAEMSPFDFIAAVAVGAIVGRVPNSDTTSYLAGATTLITLLAVHGVITRLRYFPGFAHLIDQKPRLLVSNGRVLDAELRKSGLTRDDLYGVLRQHGVKDLEEARFVIFERRGRISVIRNGSEGREPGLVREILGKASAER